MSYKKTKFRRKGLALAIATGFILTAGAALGGEKKHDLDIKLDSQSVGSALLELSRQSGVQIILSDGISRDTTLSAVEGQYSLAEALDAMLKGTGLFYEFTADDLVLIKQENPQDDAPQSEEVDEEVVVTGTRLRNVSSTAPVITITMDNIKRRGINTVEGIIRSLPQTFSSQTPVSPIDNSAPVNTLGTATANLRGLGADSTLILINGRRTTGSADFRGNVVNLNTIPFSAIERVEVITDGASAIYGSDAVAGVINFIMRKGYDAEEQTAVRIEQIGYGGTSKTFEQLVGFGWGSGTLNINLSYQEVDAIENAELGWVTRDQRSRGGIDGRNFDFSDTGTAVLVGGGFVALDPNRGNVPLTGLDEFSADFFEPRDDPPLNASDARETTSVFINVQQQVTDSISGFAELTYTRTDSQALSVFPSAMFTVPTSNAFNDTGAPVTVNYLFSREAENGVLPRQQNNGERENMGLTLGFNADLPFANWQASGNVGYSIADSFSSAFFGFRTAVFDENGVLVPGAVSPVELALADSNPDTALNLFGDGSQNPETMAAIYGPSEDFNSRAAGGDNEILTWELSANGDLIKLPGGMSSMVLGVSTRNESQKRGGFIASGLTIPTPERDVLAAFAELNVPLVGENNSFPGVESFEIRAAARWEEYSMTGDFDRDPTVNSASEKTFTNTSPSFGFAWYVTPEVKLRGQKGESFQAPPLSQLFSTSGVAQRSFFDALITPFILAGAGITEDPLTGLPIFLGAATWQSQSVANPDLLPETSDNLSYGFDWTPGGLLEGLTVSATYQEVETENVIGGTFSLFLNEPLRFLLLDGAVCRDCDAQFGQPASDDIDLFLFTSANFSLQGTRAVDVNVSYDFDTGIGQFQYGLSGTYAKTTFTQFTEASAQENTVGTRQGPNRVKATSWLTWDRDNHGAALTVNYTDSYDNERESNLEPNPQRIKHHVTFDLTGFYEFDNGWRVNGGARNVTNTNFPFLDNRTPYDPRRVDINGRVIYLDVSKSYDLF